MTRPRVLEAKLQPRALSGVWQPPGVSLTPEHFDHHTMGGPLSARVLATATDPTALAQLGDVLRCGLVIPYIPTGQRAWWGIVDGVELQLPDGRVITFQLSAQTPNRVRMRYRDSSVSDEDQFTAPVTSLDALRAYGLIEAVKALGDVSKASAEAEAAALALAERFGWPEGVRTGDGDKLNGLTIRLLGMGRFQVLHWRFVTNNAGRVHIPARYVDAVGGYEQFQQTSTDAQVAGVQDVAGVEANARVAMSLQLGGTRPVRTRTITVYVDSTGVAAVWGLEVGLWSSLSVAPSPIAKGMIYPKYVLDEDEHTPMQVILDQEVTLQLGVTYYLVLRRSDGLGDEDNVHRYTVPYQLATAPEGYARGQMYLYSTLTQTWSAKSPTAYMPFIVGQIEPKEVQPIGQALANSMIGQPFTVSGWDIYQATFPIGKVGRPAGDLLVQVRLETGAGGGTAIAGTFIPQADVADSPSEVTVTFERTMLPAGVPLRLCLTQVNYAVNPDHYYTTFVDTSIDAPGPSIDLWSNATGTWSQRPLPGALAMTIIGVAETTAQVVRTVADIAADVLPEVEIATPSGRYTPQYRDGTGRGQQDITELLEKNTIDGRRLLAAVDPHGRMTIGAQPTPDGKSLHGTHPARLIVPTAQQIEKHPELRDMLLTPTGAAVPKALCPVGYWEDSSSEIPEGFLRRLSASALVWIDGAEVRANQDGTITYEATSVARPDIYE